LAGTPHHPEKGTLEKKATNTEKKHKKILKKDGSTM